MCINLHLLHLYNRITCATVISKLFNSRQNFSFIRQKAKFASGIFFVLLCDADHRISRPLAASQSCAPQLRLKIDVQTIPFRPPRYPRHVLG